MREMRSSIVFLGAIISRCKQAKITYPGGCELGPRPIDLHLSSLKKLGVQIQEDGGSLACSVPDGLYGAQITLPFPSVGATENIMLAACMARGETVIRNAAREPEIIDLAGFLNALRGQDSHPARRHGRHRGCETSEQLPVPGYPGPHRRGHLSVLLRHRKGRGAAARRLSGAFERGAAGA